MPSGHSPQTQRYPVRPGSAAGGVSYSAQLVVDRQSVGLTGGGAATAGGVATVGLPTVPALGFAYEVERIDLWSNSGTASTASVYLGAAAPQNEIDFSSAANHDVADEQQPIYVPSGAQLNVVWSGLSVGAQVTARIQYSVIQFVPATYGP